MVSSFWGGQFWAGRTLRHRGSPGLWTDPLLTPGLRRYGAYGAGASRRGVRKPVEPPIHERDVT